jgi:hypothetical protein
MSDATRVHSSALTARAAAVARRVADLLPEPPPGTEDANAAFLRAWADAMTSALADAAETGTPSPLHQLVNRLQLSDLEADLLVLAGLSEEHEGLADVFRTLHPQRVPRPGAGLAVRIAATAGVDPTGARRVLLDGRAVTVGALRLLGDGPLPERVLAPAAGLWEVLHGSPAWPPELDPVELDATPPGLEDWLLESPVRRATAALEPASRTADTPRSTDRVVLVTADDEVVGLSRCAALAQAAGVTTAAARVRADDGPAVQLLCVHAAARGAVPLLVVAASAEGAGPARLELDGMTGPVLLCAAPGSVRPPASRAVVGVPIGPIGVEGQRSAWRSALPEAAGRAADLAARHPLDPALAAQVALDLRSAAALDPQPGRARRGAAARDPADDVPAAVRARAGVILPAGVQLSPATAGWDRLVLDGEAGQQLRDAVSRLETQSQVLDDWGLRQRARADRGVRLLFTGPPGTGKSLAAEVIATAAGTDLLIVDVSRIVSKWLGETEKHLAAAFDIAQRTQAVLFLDEADVTFGTRTEISDAQDRYANLETAYLLQRLDSFDGLAVLATNLRQNIDAAFVRRMDYVVDFPLPDEESRLRLWQLHLPPRRLARGVDLAVFARRYPVAGGWIRNAAIAAAFMAARDGTRIGTHHLEAAMAREYGKALRPSPDGAAGSHAPADARAEAALARWSTAQARKVPARRAPAREEGR